MKPTHRLDVVGPLANGASRPRSTQRAILGFLEGHAGSAFCASCISAQVVGGKDIDVAMRHLEGSGMLRRHGRCSGCGRLRLVGTLPALN